MRKNGSRLISLRQYRITDLLIFAAILVAYDMLACFAPKLFPVSLVDQFIFTLTIPITITIMIRWGWYGVFYTVLDGLVWSLTTVLVWHGDWINLLVYTIGFSSIDILLIIIKFAGKKNIVKKWYFTALFALAAWVILNFAMSVMSAIVGNSFVTALSLQFGISATGLGTLFVSVLLLMVFRRFDGMLEDQVQYLKRTDAERKDKMKRDEFGDEPIEIDKETVSILQKKDDDGY